MANDQYLVLARKWRPGAFDQVVGQEHITRTLQNAIRSERVGHAFLFIGSRGIGKTTTARILAKALNCLDAAKPTPEPCGTCNNCTSIAAGNNIDVIEIDGASNNSVDHIREVREQIRMVPAGSRYKIYIIDEVHQLSIAAFNALLKTLEEPPRHAIFILATTEAHKIPATIISRCQRYDFRRVSIEQICTLLRRILKVEGVQCSDEALYAIARAAEGGVRDSESILDQLMSYCDKEITFEDVFEVLGLVDWQMMHGLCDAMLAKDVAAQLRIIEDIVVHGKDLSQFVQDIMQYFRNLLVCKTTDASKLLAMPEEEIAEIQQRADRFTLTGIIRHVEQFAELTKGFDSQLAQRIALEATLIRMSKAAVEFSVDTVLEKLLTLSQAGPEAPTQAAPSEAKPAAVEAKKKTDDVVAAKAQAATEPEPEPAREPDYDPTLTYDPDLDTEPAQEPQAETDTASKQRFNVTGDNLDEAWNRLAAAATRDNLNLSVWLNQGKARDIEGDTLVLEFAAENSMARDIVEKTENRNSVLAAFEELTRNLRAFRCELAIENPEAQAGQHTQQPGLPFTDHVNAKDAKAALENPHIAKVIDVFKGQIVDIKHKVK